MLVGCVYPKSLPSFEASLNESICVRDCSTNDFQILAGSKAPSLYGIEAKIPEHFKDAERCGYELNLLDRVMKPKDRTSLKKAKGGRGNGYATSGQSSGSEAPYSVPKEMKEQGKATLIQKVL